MNEARQWGSWQCCAGAGDSAPARPAADVHRAIGDGRMCRVMVIMKNDGIPPEMANARRAVLKPVRAFRSAAGRVVAKRLSDPLP